MSRSLHLLLLTIWVCFLGAGFFRLLRYESLPGAAGAAPRQWPVNSPTSLATNKATLIMFVHPRCPCSRASISELGLLMAHCPGKVQARILFFTPRDASPEWTQTNLWKSASAIPGVTVLQDKEGQEARRLQAETSGEVVLYDASGKLLFHGGITAGRGHVGDNDGRAALEGLLNTGTSRQRQTPVYGCPIHTTSVPTPLRGARCRK